VQAPPPSYVLATSGNPSYDSDIAYGQNQSSEMNDDSLPPPYNSCVTVKHLAKVGILTAMCHVSSV
jgi:hypothetical protein